jgi:hypothetical protein
LLTRGALRLDIERLIYWAHWITPSALPRRFDTRFFAIAAPQTQTATADLSEASALDWMTPARALTAASSGAMPISHPTLYNLEELDASLRTHRSLEAFFANEVNRKVTPILPKMIPEGSRSTVVMPWDGDYGSTPGEGVSPECEYREALQRLPSRMTIARQTQSARYSSNSN